jgi:hypothetical protein
VALTLIYRMFATFVSWMVLHARPDRAKEILVLRLLVPETPRTPVDLPVRRRSWSSMISRWR